MRQLSLICVLVVSFAVPGPLWADVSSPALFLSRAESCRRLLEQSRPEERASDRWDRCIRKFRVAIEKSSLETLPRAAYDLGELYLSRYQRGKDPADLEAARESYLNVPQSNEGHWAARAQIRLQIVEEYASKLGAPNFVLTSLRHWSYPDYTRIVINLSHLPAFRNEELREGRMTILLPKTTLGPGIRRILSIQDGIVRQIRIRQDRAGLEVSITPDGAATPKLISLSDPDRLVIDVPRSENHPPPAPLKPPTVKPVVKSSGPGLPVMAIRTIVIDAGHGGKDPGAIGPSGLTEKEVVLDIALRLQKMVVERLKKVVLMTRSTDVFIPLEDRTLLANSKKADLFLSIHANASPRRDSRGIEVYLLGQATDAQSMETAARENSTTTEAATNFQRRIFNDLEKDFNIDQSLEFAYTVHHSISRSVLSRYPTSDLGVKRAPFFVLAKTHMPAILAELSFVSNPEEENRLRSAAYRERMAEALLSGLEQYIASLKDSF